jgi:hypothetical protein
MDDGEHYKVGDGCLNDTAFDINGGSLHFNVNYSGAFSGVSVRASGDFPSAAAQAHYDPNAIQLVVRTGNPQPDSLRFKIAGNDLEPQGNSTANILTAYGCRPDVKVASHLGY